MQASREQGLRKSHGQSASSSFDSLESLISNSSSGNSTPRTQLRARLLKSALLGGAGHSCPGEGTPGNSKSKSKLRHASSSPEIAKMVQFHNEQQQQQQLGGSEGRSASPACSDGGFPSRLEHCSSVGGLSTSKKGGKGDASSIAGLISSLFGARKPQQQLSRAGTQSGPKQQQEQSAQTGASLAGGRVTKEEPSQSQEEEAGQRALCVGRQKERAAAGDMSAELAQLRPQSSQTPRPHDFFLLAPEAAAGISSGAAELNGACAACLRSIGCCAAVDLSSEHCMPSFCCI